MRVDVSTQIEIAAPLALVAEYTANPDNAPRWYVNIKSVEWQTAPPVGPGSKIAFVARFLGRRLSYTYEVTDFQPHEHMVMRTAQGPFPMETSYIWQEIGAGRMRMTLRNRGEPSGFSRLMAPFMASAMRRANKKDLLLLKQILENEA